MGNNLEFLLKLTDMFSPVLRAAGNVSDQVCNRIASGINQVNGSSKQMASSVNELRARLDAVNQVRFGTRITSEFEAATRQARELERQIERLENKGQKRSGVGSWLTGIAAGVSAFAIGQQAFAQQANAESQQIAFKVMTGSAKEGSALYNNIVKMADVTPYESQDLARSGKTMLNYGVDKKDIMPDLHLLGDVAAAADDPKVALQELSLAFGQVTAKGHLAGQEALQLVNAGFNPLKEISVITGKSMNDLDKAMSKGAITADMVRLAFQHATGPGGKFHDMMKEQSETLGGKWSTFMDQVHHKLRDLGAFFEPVAKNAMEFATALLNGEGPAVAIAIAIGGITLALTGATIATRIFNFVVKDNPIGFVISLLIALGLWIYSIAKKYEGWGKSMQAVWEITKSFVSLNITAWKALGEAIWYYIQFGWLKFESFIQWIGGALQNLNNAFSLLSEGKFGAAKDALFKEIITPASKAIDELQAKHKASQAEFAKTAAAAVQTAADNYKKIGLHKIPGAANAVDPTTANAGGGKVDASSFGSLGDAGKSKAKSINEGGQRSIHITIGKQIEKLEVHVMDAKEGVNEIEAMVREAMRRVLYSVNGVATN